MAKRRKLTAPSPEDLSRIEEEFRRETPDRSATAPIAQVAAETTQAVEVNAAETRARLAKAERAAQTLQEAEAQGLILQELALDAIVADAMFRDRLLLDEEELEELRQSVLANGLRMPIEVFEMDAETPQTRYGLISGYRRLMVMRELHEQTQDPTYATIKAFVRPPKSSADRFAAVVEENEVRSALSHFERGRFAALTVANGVFQTVEEAVNTLFPFASKAKRSKVRSFALVFEEIGDLLTFGDKLTEKQGLRIAAALRLGAERALRDAIAEALVRDSADEWNAIEGVLAPYEANARDPSRGGRPSKKSKGAPEQSIETTAGIKVSWMPDAGGYVIRLKGQGLDQEIVESLIDQIRYALGKP